MQTGLGSPHTQLREEGQASWGALPGPASLPEGKGRETDFCLYYLSYSSVQNQHFIWLLGTQTQVCFGTG